MSRRADLDRITNDLARLVAIPSITGDEDAIQAHLADLLEETGAQVGRLDVPLAEVETDPGFPGTEIPRTNLPIVVGRVPGTRPGPRLMLVGHVDVVPPGDPGTWTTPAFEPEVRGGRMFGRGACDMKGGMVAILEALRLLEGSDLAGEIVVLAVPSEEDGGAGSFATIRRGFTADACVITEPTNLDIVVAHGGAITFTLTVPGRAAHASMRREGVSALDNLTYLVAALAADEQRRNAEETHPLMQAIGLPYPTIVGRVQGGDWASTVMDRVEAHGRYGVMLGQDCDGAAADLRRAIADAAQRHEFLTSHPPAVEVWGGSFDSAAIPADHALPRALAAAAARVTGTPPARVGAPYGADMRLFINQGGTPTVMYGPGDVRDAHAADESVALADVARCAEVLAAWIRTELGSDAPDPAIGS